MNSKNFLKKIIEKYKLDQPVSHEVKKHIKKIKGQQFKRIFKQTGKYSIIFYLISKIFFAFKNAGINITIAKAAAIFAVTSASVAGGLAAGGYYAFKYYTAAVVEEKKITLEDNEPVNKSSKTLALVPIPSTGIRMLESDAKITGVAERITNKILSTIGNIRKDDIVLIDKSTARIPQKIIAGSVEHVNGKYVILVKLIDSSTSKILYYAEKQAPEADLDEKCAEIAREIAEAP